jgi:hypothetical protein
MESLYLETNPFTIFNGEHWIWLMYGVLSTIFWIRLGRKAPTQVQKQRVALWMGLLGVIAWVYSDLVMLPTSIVYARFVAGISALLQYSVLVCTCCFGAVRFFCYLCF